MFVRDPDGSDAWWRHLAGRPFYWVLDGSHPAADLLMLREVVERPSEAPAVADARLALWEWAPIQRAVEALAATDDATVRLRLLRQLAELGVSGDDARIAEALDGLLDLPPASPDPTNHEAILLSLPLAFGYGSDPRVARRLAPLLDRLRAREGPADGAQQADWVAQYVLLLGLAGKGQPEVVAAAQEAATELLALDPATLPARWHTFGETIGAAPDILRVTRALLGAGITDPRLAAWVGIIEAQQVAAGGWLLGRSGDGPLQLETVGMPSRWISAQALAVLRIFYGE